MTLSFVGLVFSFVYLGEAGLEGVAGHALLDAVVIVLGAWLRLWLSLALLSGLASSPGLGGWLDRSLDGADDLVGIERLLERLDDPSHPGGHVGLQLRPLVPELLLHHLLRLLPGPGALHRLGLVVEPDVAFQRKSS